MALLCALIYIMVVRVLRSKCFSDPSLLQDVQSRSEDLPRDLRYEDVIRATEGRIIGKGKHGTVYRTLSNNSRKHWAVKKLNRSETNFDVEIRTLSLVRHRNILRIVGSCTKDEHGFIATEYMPGGTLFNVLHQNEPRLVLDWNTRYHIALGIVQGLSYLHYDFVPQIIHRDIKSDNILLDSELEPKIGDFGMSKLISDSHSSSTRSAIVGSLGYIAPENAYSTRLTEKSDVYSYGVILFELLFRKMPVDPCFGEDTDIVTWTRWKLQENHECICFLDRDISFWDSDDQLKALRLLELALECTRQVADMRPSMREVVGFLIKLNDKNEGSIRR